MISFTIDAHELRLLIEALNDCQHKHADRRKFASKEKNETLEALSMSKLARAQRLKLRLEIQQNQLRTQSL